jgi:hypothetical protein
MNKKSILFAVLLLLLALLSTAHLRAQDVTPVPTAEATPPPGVDTTTTTTTTTTSPVEDIGLTLTWLLAFLALWQAAGIAYAVTVEKTLKPVLYGIIGTFTSDERIRSAVLIIAVFIGAFYVVSSGGINLFVDAPFGLFTGASAAFMLVLNSVFVAVGAFIGHELWQTFESWLKKAKAVTDVFTAQSPRTANAQAAIASQPRRYNTGAPADGEDR